MQLTIDRLTKQYKNKIAVDRISLTLKEGVYGLLGANGAGKTTLMRMLCGVLKPTGGEVSFDGIDVSQESYRDALGYLPQDFGYYPEFTALDFMLYMASLKEIPKQKAKRKTAELFEIVSLTDVAKRKIKTFSGGMKQRLGIAQAMLNDPKILVLDEPTAGLDPKERVRFRNLIAQLAKDRIVLLSTHIVSDVEYIADEILLMKKGSLLMQGSIEELTKTAFDKVYSIVVSEAEAEQLASQYCIANLHHVDGQVEVRIISDEPPQVGAVPVTPTLEDVYLLCLADTTEVLP